SHGRSGGAISTSKDAASSPAGRETTRSSRSWASTGTSSIWCGCSSSPSSIYGEADHGAAGGNDSGTYGKPCGGAAAPPQDLFRGLGMAVRSQRLLVSRRLLPSAGISQMDPDPPLHD